ncbi:Plasmodium vivax Vir protein, putative [Plasmodium vivax]|uniref:Vir protein, putative n=1 Tax=Plasmodium vivax TaxID=5855 RepID=A0A1G4EBF5_PLAVI|nr:Plasmodium vivax Vir protein, putative [Plasmodium vivax]
MCSTRSPGKESYDFFEKIEDYIEKVKSVESSDVSSIAETGCNTFMQSFGSYFTFKETANIICKQFIKLYVSLNELKCNSNSDPNYEKCNRFLKYWVNFKLRKSMKNKDDCAYVVYNGIESHNMGSDDYHINLDFEDDINNEDLYKMHILYSLYEKYSKLKTIIEGESKQNIQSLLPHSNECCTHYIEAKYICNGGNNNNSAFCKELETFVSKYEKLYQKFEVKRSDFSDSLIKLTECPNNKTITTAVTGTVVGLIPLFGVLYKFTPMGQVLKSKIGILNKDISKNDEEMANISLMEQENDQLRFQKGTYNIKYQSL